MSDKENTSSHAMFASVAGILLGATAAAVYMISKDTRKQEQLKTAVDDMKKTAADRLDKTREKLNRKTEDVEDEIDDLRKNDHGLTVH